MPTKRRGAQIFNMMLKYCHFLPTYLILITPSPRNLLQILDFGQIETLTISQPHSSGFMNAILSIQSTLYVIACNGEDTYYSGFSSKATPHTARKDYGS